MAFTELYNYSRTNAANESKLFQWPSRFGIRTRITDVSLGAI